MKRFVLAAALVAFCCIVGVGGQEPQPKQQLALQGLNIVVYPTPGTPLVVHLHGAQGEVHIWVVTEQNPADEAKRLEQIRKLLPKSPSPQ